MNFKTDSRPVRAALFLLPFLVVFGPPLFVMIFSGEFTDPVTVLRRQEKPGSTVLYGPAYSDVSISFKFHSAARRQPRLLVLGNSRVMELASEFFRPDAGFYNAGGSVVRLRHCRAFVEALPAEAGPKFLIVGLHQPFFNAAFDSVAESGPDSAAWLVQHLESDANPGSIFFTYWRPANADLLSGKIPLGKLLKFGGTSDRVGLSAVIRERGFRADGSYLYPAGEAASEHSDRDFHRTYASIAAGSDHFAYGAGVSPASVQEVEQLATFCQKRGIHLIAFLPPFPHAVWSRMQAEPNHYGYMTEIDAAIRPVLAKNGAEFFDFSDLAAVGAGDEEALDGYHGSDKAYLRMVIAMVKGGSRLAEVADLGHLEQLLTTAPSGSGVFGRKPSSP